MATTALLAKGVKVEVDTLGDGSEWFKLGMLKKVSKPAATIDEIDATDMDSTAKEFISGLADFGELPLTLNWKPGDATDVYIETWREGGNETRNVRITTPNAKTYTVPAFIKTYGGDMQVGSIMESTLTLRAAGDVTRGG